MDNNNKKSSPGPSDPVDYIQKSIGSFGMYQFWLCVLVFFSKMPIAWHQMAIIFLAPRVSFTCGEGGPKDSCPCENPVYNRTIFTRTIVMEWNLICQRRYLASLSQTIFQFGTLIGSVLFGMASDRWGRRPPFIGAVIIQLVAGIGAAYIPSYIMFNILRFLVGISVGGTMVIGFVCVMEFCGAKYRPLLSALYQLPFNVGFLMLAGYGYLFRDYSEFQLAISAPVLLMLSYICLLPETPRWLIAMKRLDETVKVCERAAAVNKLPTGSVRSDITSYLGELERHHLKKGTLVDLFKTPNIRKNNLSMAFNWLACSYCFYGVSQYISHLTGDIFTNVACSAAVTILGTCLSIPLIKYMRRKTMLITFQAICAICLYILAFIPESIASVCCASIGNVAAFIVFILVYLYCSELFPTVVRNAAIGFSSMAARIGSMIAPFVIGLKDSASWLPAVVFAIMPTLACAISLLLPETKDVPLMTTLEEGEMFGKKDRTEQ